MTGAIRAYESLDEIEAVVGGFESCRLPPPELTHAAHLTVGLWYLSRLTVPEATARIRAGLHRFLDYHGVGREKYNETITIFWIKLVRKFLDDAEMSRPLLDITNEAIESLGGSQLIFDYYSRERLFSDEAKTAWVEPDLKPLDF
ncbi:MAG: hypothetical protein WCF57_19610 [Pyrinomonadaceae bacterium]